MRQGTTLAVAMAAGVWMSAATVEAVQPDLIRTISGQQYRFIDYTYYDARSNPSGNFDVYGRLYVPDDYDPSKTYPVVVFLHGMGEAMASQPANTVNSAQVNGNINNLIRNAGSRDFLLYVPQARYTYWSDDQHIMTMTALARAAKEYNVDVNRIYATGLSMGGAGVHGLMSNYPEFYAAFVPLSPASAYNLDAEAAAGRPAWYFHGREDGTVGVGVSRSAVRSLVLAQGGTAPTFPNTGGDFYYSYGSVRYTEYATAGHTNAVWNNGAYNLPEMYDWMLSHQTSFTSLQPGQSIGVSLAGSANVITQYAGQTWNAVGRHGADNTLNFMLGFGKSTDGERTTVSFELTGAFDGTGNAIPTGITAFDDPAVAGKFWRTGANSSAEITIHGLVPGWAYDLEIFASIAANGYTGLYQVGDVSAVLNASFNTDQFALLSNVIADSEGTLTLVISPTGGSSRAVINTLMLTAVPEPTMLTAAGATLLLLVRRRRAD